MGFNFIDWTKPHQPGTIIIIIIIISHKIDMLFSMFFLFCSFFHTFKLPFTS